MGRQEGAGLAAYRWWVAGLLGIGTKKMYQLCTAGAVRHKKVGRRIRISPADLYQVAEVTEAKPADPVAKLQAFFRS